MRSLSGEHSVSVNTAQRLHVLLAGLAPNGIGNECVTRDAKLGAEKGRYGVGDQFAGSKGPTWIAQCTQLQREPDPVLRSAPPIDMDQVIVCQNIMAQQRRLVGR